MITSVHRRDVFDYIKNSFFNVKPVFYSRFLRKYFKNYLQDENIYDYFIHKIR
jgi:hypothetical protein